MCSISYFYGLFVHKEGSNIPAREDPPWVVPPPSNSPPPPWEPPSEPWHAPPNNVSNLNATGRFWGLPAHTGENTSTYTWSHSSVQNRQAGSRRFEQSLNYLTFPFVSALSRC